MSAAILRIAGSILNEVQKVAGSSLDSFRNSVLCSGSYPASWTGSPRSKRVHLQAWPLTSHRNPSFSRAFFTYAFHISSCFARVYSKKAHQAVLTWLHCDVEASHAVAWPIPEGLQPPDRPIAIQKGSKGFEGPLCQAPCRTLLARLARSI